MFFLYMQAAGQLNEQSTDYRSLTYWAVERISHHNNGDVFRCTVDFRHSDEIEANVDSVPPEFNFTWRSSAPLNVQCKYNVIGRN